MNQNELNILIRREFGGQLKNQIPRAFIIFVFLAGLIVVTGNGCYSIVEKRFNTCETPVRPEMPESVTKFHSRLFIADLHADSLLWKRNLLKRSDYGHLDIPRAIEGNLGFQVFGVVTKTPKGQNIMSNGADSDQIKMLTILQNWPVRSWNSLLERALYQAAKLKTFADDSQGRLIRIQSREDLDSLVDQRQAGSKIMGGFCGLEGIHALEGNLQNLDKLYDAGFRMIGLHHFFDNKAGGSAHGLEKKGLTDFGVQLVKNIQAKGMVIDLAHSSPKVIDDVLKLATSPVVVSHTGVKGTCDNQRNLSDSQILGISQTGGVIGIALFDKAVCGNTVDDTAKAMRYTADLAGVDHVGLGSDFDGAVKTPVNVTGLSLLTEALLKQGFSESETAKIMGENSLRVFRQTLKRTDYDTKRKSI